MSTGINIGKVTGGEIKLDLNLSKIFRMTLLGDVTVSLLNITDKSGEVKIFVSQDKVGGHSLIWGEGLLVGEGVAITPDQDAYESSEFTITLNGSFALISDSAENITEVTSRVEVDQSLFEVFNTDTVIAAGEIVANLGINSSGTPVYSLTEIGGSGYVVIAGTELQLTSKYFTERSTDINTEINLLVYIDATVNGQNAVGESLRVHFGKPGAPQIELSDAVGDVGSGTDLSVRWDAVIIDSNGLNDSPVADLTTIGNYSESDLSFSTVSRANDHVWIADARVRLDFEGFVQDLFDASQAPETFTFRARDDVSKQNSNLVTISPEIVLFQTDEVSDRITEQGRMVYDLDLTFDPGPGHVLWTIAPFTGAPVGYNVNMPMVGCEVDGIASTDIGIVNNQIMTLPSWNEANFSNGQEFELTFDYADPMFGGLTSTKVLTITVIK